MENLEIQILEFGRKKEISSITALLSNISQEELANFIKSQINTSNFLNIWKYMLQSFNDTATCHRNRMIIILSLLEELQEREVLSYSHSTQLIQMICMELFKLKSEHLVEICNFCLNMLQSNKPCLNISWKDLLPDTLRILSERDVIEFNELEYTGQEFKAMFINTLCMSNWCPNIIISITAMFIDMPLTKEEHLKVVTKLASYIEKLTPQEVPPFVYQLLKFCRHQNCRIIFLKLQTYFGLRIYNNTNLVRNNSTESHDFDCIENAEDHDVLEAESTVLFHIQNAASIGHICIKDYLNSLKNIIKSPEFILHPFQLLALFSISTVQQYKEIVYDIIRHSIVRSYNDQQKSISSRWYRDFHVSSHKPEAVFSQIINLGDREFLLEVLVHFGFVLLSVGSALGRDVIAEKQWTLGTTILLKIIKKKRHIASTILKTFCNHIITRHNSTQYIECLYIMSRSLPLLMSENQSCIVELMESLVQIPANVANPLLDALIPLTKISPIIRDQFILILRKALYSRSIEVRQVAVNGFIKLITSLKISNIVVLSGSSGSFSSGYSLYTQISLNRSTQTLSTSILSSEAICWEILGILKRALMQQAEVRAALYGNLYNAVCFNSELAIPILDMLWFHFAEYYVMDEDSIPPLYFNKVASLRESDSILLEPLGKLIYTISQVVTSVIQSEDSDNTTVVKYLHILESLCSRMANCELVHLELDDGTDLTDILPESEQKMHILREVICVYEALIGYKISSWVKENENYGCTINSLYQGYSRFLQFGKNLVKPKKTKKNDKLSQKNKQNKKKVMGETQSETNNTTKIDSDLKSRSILFKSPETLLSFKVVDKGLKILLESSVPWATVSEANIIKTKTELHKHFIQASIVLTTHIKNHKFVDTQDQKFVYDNITSIGTTLYNRVIKKFNDYVDFDCVAAVTAIDCFHSILLLINGHFKSNLVHFLSAVGGKEKELEIEEHLKPLIQEFQKLFDSDEEDISNEPDIKKLPSTVISCLSILCSFIPDKNSILANQVYDWFKHVACNKTVTNKVSGPFMNLLFDIHLRYKVGLNIFEQTAISLKNLLGMVTDESVEESEENLKIVDISTANSVILSLCSNMKTLLEDIDSSVARIKSDCYILSYSLETSNERSRDDLKSKEKGVCCQLCLVLSVLKDLVTVVVQPGNITDAILKCIIQFYSSLSSLTKYFLSRSSKNNLAFQGAWFEKLVKLTGKQLTPLVYKLISYIGESQSGENPSQNNKKRVEGATMKSKILRETKIIPKVIYEIEQLSKYLIQLTKKTKVDLAKYVGQGTVRDFRIVHLKETLEQAGVYQELTQNTEVPTADQSNCNEELNEDSNEENRIDNGAPPAKKLKH